MSRLKPIQILRALAAISVSYDHVWHEAAKFGQAAALGISMFDVPISGAGVDLFFVISGFLMVYTSRDLFGAAGGVRVFMMRRILRIVPLYWLLTAIFLGCGGFFAPVLSLDTLADGGPPVSEIVKSFFFIPYVAKRSGLVQPVLKLGWTLNYEVFFYLIFASTLILKQKTALWALCMALSGLCLAGVWLSPGPGLLRFWSEPILLEFLIGALIGQLFLDGKRTGTLAAFSLLLAGLAGLGIATRTGLDLYGPARILLAGVPAAAIVAAAVWSPPWTGRSVLTAALAALGDASYSLYLTHPAIIRGISIVWNRTPLHGALPIWVYLVVTLAASVAAAFLISMFVEQPLTKQLVKWVMPRREGAAAAAGPHSGVAEAP